MKGNSLKMKKKAKHRKIVNKYKFFRILTIVVLIIVGIVTVTFFIGITKQENQEGKSIETANLETQKELEERDKIEQEKIEREKQKQKEEEKIGEYIEQIKQEKHLTEDKFSFFYQNVDIGSSYFFNEEKYFTAASTIKVPLTMLYYDQINEGEKTLESALTYKSGCYEVGDGKTASSYKIGNKVPLNFLMNQAIVKSDNTATNILIQGMGFSEYRKQIAKYSERELIKDFYKSNITSAGYACDVLTHIVENKSNYEILLQDMKQSSYGEYLKNNIEEYEVAHKYGSYNGYVHDYGIIYGENTYLIGIFTKGVSNAKDLIASIGEQVVNLVEIK